MTLDWFSLISGILGGLVFFLYGMDLMSAGLKSGLGESMSRVMTKLNTNRFSSALTGIIVTAITQSTGATTVMLMSFVETGIMRFAQTVPVIIGANIGSTVTAQVIAFDIAGYAILPVILGFFLKQFKNNDRLRDGGNVIFGFGLVFFGMQFLGRAVSILKDYPAFTDMIASAETPIVGFLVGILATCIMQSTGMFTGILVVFAQQGLMGISQAYPLLVGSSVGTCLLIIIVSIGTSDNCKRVMLAHVLTKIAGALVFLALTPFAVRILEWFSAEFNISPERQIANTHTFFYTLVAVFLICFSNGIVKAIEKIIPEKDADETIPHLRYIDFNVLTMPQSALELSISETATIIKLTSRIFDNAVSAFISYDPESPAVKKQNQKTIDDLSVKQKKLDYIESEIRKYLSMIGRNDTSDAITGKIFALLSVLEQTKRISDIVHRSFVPAYNQLSRLDNTFSADGMKEITYYYREISNHFQDLIFAMERRDYDFMKRVYSETEETKSDSEKLRISHLKRLWDDRPDTRATHEIHIGLIDDLSEIASVLSTIAYSLQKSVILFSGTA
jgi:phosphate:Na+ symporter